MTEKRFMVDDCGTLIDMQTRDMFDIVEEVCPLLNELYEENQELYDFRFVFNALLFNIWHKYNEIEVYKSKKHHDGELCFDGEWFIVVAILPDGKQVTNHYPIKYWSYFKIPSYEKVKDKFDGHTSKVVFERLLELIGMTERYEIIWDFCDWLGEQGLAYEILYFGGTNDIDKLINRYLIDEKWHNRKKELEE